MKLTVLNKLSDHHQAILQAAAPGLEIFTCSLDQLGDHIADTDILAPWGSDEIRPFFASGQQLRWVHSLSAGVENLIFPEIQASNIILTNSRGIHSIPVSEHVLALLFAFSRCLPQTIRQQDRKIWKRLRADELHEKAVGIIGLGSIGREIAKKAKALGMKVLAAKRELTEELFVDELFASDDLLNMLPQCDYVVTALPLLPETHNLLQRRHFQAMKPTACFINIARGAVVCETDLIAALETKEIRGAGLDVFEHEPLPEASPLWEMPNVIITPHVAAFSPYYMDRAIRLFADNLARFVAVEPLVNMIDKQKGY